MKFIIGKKIEMTQVFDEKGNAVPVCLVEAGPCVITDIKTKERDGYSAVQIGFEKKKDSKVGKSEKGKGYKHLKEFRVEAGESKVGDKILASVFESLVIQLLA